MPIRSEPRCLNRFFVSEYSRTEFADGGAHLLCRSQSLLRQRILPDCELEARFQKFPDRSQSLLRQRILPDVGRNQYVAVKYGLSQSLLRQRILPDGSRGSLRADQPDQVSIASSSANTPGRYVAGKMVSLFTKSQSLLRQRILPDELKDSFELAIVKVSIASSSANTPGLNSS